MTLLHSAVSARCWIKKIVSPLTTLPCRPALLAQFAKGLVKQKLNAKPARVVMEKPLGTSLATSQEINDQVGEYFEECRFTVSTTILKKRC